MNKSPMSSSSSNSNITSVNATTRTMAEEFSETRDSCYFPGCRKDANCNCEMCLASITATLDLMPISIQKNSLSKFSTSRSRPHRTPVSFDPSVLSTPTSGVASTPQSTRSKTAAKLPLHSEKGMKRKFFPLGAKVWKWVLLLGLILFGDFGFSFILPRIVRLEFSHDVVREIAEKSVAFPDSKGKLGFLRRELKNFVGNRLLNCNSRNSKWVISQDDLLVISRCTLYRSVLEEVNIWGWPLRTGGLLRARSSSRSFTIIQGRITEWPEGSIIYSIREANSSWRHQKWSASVVQLDPNTLVLEYSRSMIMENSSLSAALLELLKSWISGTILRMKQKFWYSSLIGNEIRRLVIKDNTKVPT